MEAYENSTHVHVKLQLEAKRIIIKIINRIPELCPFNLIKKSFCSLTLASVHCQCFQGKFRTSFLIRAFTVMYRFKTKLRGKPLKSACIANKTIMFAFCLFLFSYSVENLKLVELCNKAHKTSE